jgi:hypothetical protein
MISIPVHMHRALLANRAIDPIHVYFKQSVVFNTVLHASIQPTLFRSAINSSVILWCNRNRVNIGSFMQVQKPFNSNMDKIGHSINTMENYLQQAWVSNCPSKESGSINKVNGASKISKIKLLNKITFETCILNQLFTVVDSEFPGHNSLVICAVALGVEPSKLCRGVI